MELHFIWIEEYKNIKNQGFNFNPRKWFEYDPESGILTVSDRKDKVIDGFFGEKITNVTAIIGKNGSGKSNFIEYLLKRIASFGDGAQIWEFEFSGVIILFENCLYIPENFLISNQKELEETGFQIRIFNQSLNLVSGDDYDDRNYDLRKNSYIHYSNFLDARTPGWNLMNLIDLSTNNLIHTDYYNLHSSNVDYNNSDHVEINTYGPFLNMEVKRHLDFISASFDQLPFSLPRQLGITITELWKNRHLKFSEKFAEGNGILEQKMHLDELMYSINYELDKNAGNRFKRLLSHCFLIALILEFPKEFSGLKYEDFRLWIYEEKYPDFQNHEPLRKRIEILGNYFLALNKLYNIGEVGFLDEESLPPETSEWEKYNHIVVTIDEKTVKELTILHDLYLKITEKEFLKFYWEGNSSGERALLNLFARIYSAKKNRKLDDIENILIIIDEGETGFHPQWQKSYLSNLINFLPKVFDQKIQLILTTHSPFLISDLPKEYIIFLDKDDAGNCKVVPGVNMQKTLGANIHSLFSDSFFIQGGLIGDFAKDSIYQVIDAINGKKDNSAPDWVQKKENWGIFIDKVGEPILRQKLIELYKEDLDSQILWHEDELKRLKQEKQKRNDKNK